LASSRLSPRIVFPDSRLGGSVAARINVLLDQATVIDPNLPAQRCRLACSSP
jgi:hypothetical protein